MFSKWFYELTVKIWWIWATVLLCGIVYERALHNLHAEYQRLYAQLIELEVEKKDALEIRDKLLLQLNSQSDHDWIELTLMRGLGLVPEGQTKVFFQPHN